MLDTRMRVHASHPLYREASLERMHARKGVIWLGAVPRTDVHARGSIRDPSVAREF